MPWILPVLVALPFLAATPAYMLSKRKPALGLWFMCAVTLAEFALALTLFLGDQTAAFSAAGVIGHGLFLRGDGFRTLYALVAAFMWLMTSLFSPQYFRHGHAQGRYALFTLMTLGATMGVFLSDDLITTFMFFEVLSFTSYCWVIHEQTPGAMRAGQTYLAIAILGGMAMLMGLMMLYGKTGTLRFEELAGALEGMPRKSLYLPGILILAGFGAKAGMFPLHVWLPKAHPVAPAPASALLSGVLTKVGIYGILVLSTRLFAADLTWGQLLLGLGLINMLLGAVLALFSIDLKRTLACSSMSQIGFILFGIGTSCLLGEHNALAAQGTVLHMLNHSLIKLALFMAAGVVYLNTHTLDLNEVRGYGRRKPGLMLIFLVGAASISGIPFFSGYASKTLLHESMIEYIVHVQDLGQNALLYQIAEWLFVITGGLTFCYMLKLFITIFVQKHPTRQEEYDRMGASMTPLSAFALGGSALVLFVLGLFPQGPLTELANRSLPFLKAHEPAHAVDYLAWVNLSGGGKSLVLGIVFYALFVQRWLSGKDDDGQSIHLNRWPAWLDMEDRLYRPMVKALVKLGYAIAIPLDAIEKLFPFTVKLGYAIAIPLDAIERVMQFAVKLGYAIAIPLGAIERVFPALNVVFTFLSRLLESLVDSVTLLLMRTVFKRTSEIPVYPPAGNHATFALGRFAGRINYLSRRAFGLAPKDPNHYVYLYAAVWTTFRDTVRRLLRTLSFGLILFALGLVVLLALLLIK